MPPTAAAMYPSARLLARALDELTTTLGCNFTAAEVLASNSIHDRCCVVGGNFGATNGSSGGFYFGQTIAGYNIINRRDSSACWPTTQAGRPCPVRLTRWMCSAPTGVCVRHTCDTPACIARGHLVLGTQRDNLCDAIGRKRRSKEGRARPPRAHTRTAPLQPSSQPRTRAQGQDADSVFCMTGFFSPSKKARKRAKASPPTCRRACAHARTALSLHGPPPPSPHRPCA